MTRPQTAAVRKFNPGLFQSDEDVIAQFAVRRHELDVVLETVRDNLESPSCQHVLIVAPRGRGKTMLLARAAAELRTNAALASRVLPVRFMEESHEILTLADFWLEALFHLARETGARDPGLARELRATHADLNSRWRERDLADRARASVVEAAELLDRKLVLMVENLQALCGAVDDDFGWGLRQALQMEPRIMLVGTATSRFAALDDPREAFFELFRAIPLGPLDTESCRRLWLAAGGGERSEREIRPLQILTGGNPRLLVIVAAFARSKSLRRLMDELVALIDDHTEYFRSHLEGMAKTERRVYLAAIDLWRPSSAAEIADRARVDVRTASAMLGRLVERGAIMAEEREGKRYYFAAERLYCIYYKMRRERDEAEIVRQFIHFMSVFYGEKEIQGIFSLWRQDAAQFPATREGVGKIIETIAMEFEGRDSSGGQKHVAQLRLGDVESEINAENDTAARFGDADAPVRQATVAEALFNKGIAQSKLGNTQAEMAAYDDVVARFGDSPAPELRDVVAGALLNKGVARGRIGDARAAITTYDEVIARFGNNEISELRETVAKALVNKGGMQEHIGDTTGAMATFDEVVVRFGSSETSELQAVAASALVNKGAVQMRIGDTEATIAACDSVVAQFGNADTSELCEQVARAYICKAIAQHAEGKMDDVMNTCDEIDRWLTSIADKGVPESDWWTAAKGAAAGMRAAALAVCGRRQAAFKAFRSAYAVSRLGDDLTTRLLTLSVIELAAGGVSPRDMVDVLSQNRAKAEALSPLLVALRRRAGETVRAAAEILEVADDIDRGIEGLKEKESTADG